MPISYEESIVLLKQFRKTFSFAYRDPVVVGVEVIDEGKPSIVVEITSNSTNLKDLLPNSISYFWDGEQREADIRTNLSKIRYFLNEQSLKSGTKAIAGRVRAGDAAQAANSIFSGTVGWSFRLNGVVVGISNWHVLCMFHNDTPKKSRILLNNLNIAELYAFEKVFGGGYPNTWDYALARYDNPHDAEGSVRLCQDGSQREYPQDLSKNIGLSDGNKYWTVGNKPPICSGESDLISIGDSLVEDSSRNQYWFVNQLIFSKISDTGDSGSIVVRRSDNTVTGLIFAGSEDDTVANPIFLAPWRRTGSIRFDGNSELPMFEGSPTFSSSSLEIAPETTFFDNLRVPSVLDILSPSLLDIPNFEVGLYFLGTAVMRFLSIEEAPYYISATDPLPGGTVWMKAPPPGIPDRGPVQCVLVAENRQFRNGNRQSIAFPYYFCFG